MKTKLIALSLIAIAGIGIGCISGCASSSIAKAQAAVSAMDATAAKLQVQEANAVPLVAAVSGSNANVSNSIAYAETITADAQTLAPLLSGLISLIPTTGTTAAHYTWTPSGIAALHRHGISPNDRYAIQKLYRAEHRLATLSGSKTLAPKYGDGNEPKTDAHKSARPAQNISDSLTFYQPFTGLNLASVQPTRSHPNF